MPNLATVTLIGHLGRDPEIRWLPDGSAVCNFSIATSEKAKDQEYTTWWRINVWGKQAESCEQYLSKGRAVCVQGRVGMRPYIDREGNERSSLEVNAQSVVFLGGREPGDSDANHAEAGRGFSTDKQGRVVSPPMDDDSGIPF